MLEQLLVDPEIMSCVILQSLPLRSHRDYLWILELCIISRSTRPHCLEAVKKHANRQISRIPDDLSGRLSPSEKIRKFPGLTEICWVRTADEGDMKPELLLKLPLMKKFKGPPVGRSMEWISSLTNLTDLDLLGGRSTSTTNATLSSLVNLNRLEIAVEYSLDTLDFFHQMTRLSSLNLRFMRFDTFFGEIPSSCASQLTSLSVVTSASTITIDNRQWVQLSNLRCLKLTGVSFDISGMSLMTNLESLYINTPFKKITKLTTISRLTNLTDLSLLVFPESTCPVFTLLVLTRLRSLQVNCQSLSSNGLGDRAISKLSHSLTYLDLTDTDIVSDDGLALLTNLTSLRLSTTSLITSSGLSTMTQLRVLDTSSPLITMESILRLTLLESLTVFMGKYTLSLSSFLGLEHLKELWVYGRSHSNKEIKEVFWERGIHLHFY